MATSDEILAEMEETYAKVNVELQAYSEAANRNDTAAAAKHMAEADRLSAHARSLTRTLTRIMTEVVQ